MAQAGRIGEEDCPQFWWITCRPGQMNFKRATGLALASGLNKKQPAQKLSGETGLSNV